MKLKKYTCLILLSGLTAFYPASAQPLTAIQRSLTAYSHAAVQEKLYVHTDKSFYITGEILWLKIYNTDAAENKPLDVSKVAYVEILDHNQTQVAQAKVSLKNGTGNGSIGIPVTLADGNYKLRAYTNWMKNFNADYYFEKLITIVNPLRSSEEKPKQNALTYDIQFFPEGGNLVRGVTSRVAFKVTDDLGYSVNCSGAVLSQKNDTIVRFKTLKFGIGSFIFTPQAGDTYRAVIRTDGRSVPAQLPAIKDRGYSMRLTGQGNGRLHVEVSGADVAGEVYLLAHTRNGVKVAKTASLSAGKADFTFNSADLGEGISHITVFNADRQPVCERLYFKRPQQKLDLSLAADKPVYGLRNRVALNVASKQGGKPVAADLSVSVYQLDSLQRQSDCDIMSYLWLKSELRGNIESPDYYFSSTSPQVNEALDNLMLSQGWRRFAWSDVLSQTKPAFKYLPEFTGHLVTATIVDSVTKRPAANILAYMGMPGKRIQLYTAKSDSAGRLVFNTKDFYGQAEIVLQTNFEKDSTYRIEVQNPFSEQYSSATVPGLQLHAAVETLLKRHSLEMQVQNIYAGDQLRKYLDPGADSTAFYLHPWKSYNLDDYTRFATMEEVLREYVKEVFVAKRKKRYNLDILAGEGFLRGDNPLVMLDGVPVFNMDRVLTIDPLKVQRLEVVPSQYFYGPSNILGILSFTTYKGDFGGFEIDPRAVIMDYEGLQLQRQFYSPVYDTDAKVKSRVPDYRNVLYWSPSAGTNAGGQNAISFYTGDQPGRYIGVVQGITADGKAGSAYVTFDVKK